MNPHRIRTAAFVVAGLLLLVQFVLQQLGEGIQASGIVLVVAAAIFLGLAVMRMRAPAPDHDHDGLGIADFALLVLVAVLTVITAGLAAIVLL